MLAVAGSRVTSQVPLMCHLFGSADLDRATGDQLLVPGNQCIVQLNGEAGSGAVDSEAIIQDYDYEGQIVSAFVQSLGMR